MTPLIEKTVGALLAESAARFPDRDAVVFPEADARYTYAEFDALCSRFARGLMALDLEPGAAMAVWCTNRPEWVVCQMGSARAGVVMVTVNPAYRPNELDYLLRQSESQCLVLIERFRDNAYLETVFGLIPELSRDRPGELRSERYPKLRHVVFIGSATPPGCWNFRELLARGDGVSAEALARRAAALSPDDPINIQYTSGTTGNPKGAMLSHRNIVNNAWFVGEGMRFTPEDRLCSPVPLYHCFGCVLGSLLSVVYGATCVYPAEAFDAEKTLRAIARERCTAIYGVPTMFIAELDHPDFASFDLSSLRTGIMAGAPCPIEVMRKVVDRMGAREMTIAYGLTETSPVITMTRTQDSLERRVSTVGRALPHVEVKIAEPDTGREAPRGTQGELCARGYLVMKGYYQDPARTAEVIDGEGWLHSGDLGVMDEEGYCRITGRIKDVIIRGGENVYPREVEEYLFRHPKVSDAQVFGVPSERLGEEVAAWIKLREGESATEEEIRGYCLEGLARFKVPRVIRFVSDFPMTVTGKIQKFRMREAMIKELGLERAARIETA
jgi:fatty-acyl-CoA synthase